MNIPKEDIDEFIEWAAASIDVQRAELVDEFKKSDQKNRHGMSTDEFIKRHARLERFSNIVNKLASL